MNVTIAALSKHVFELALVGDRELLAYGAYGGHVGVVEIGTGNVVEIFRPVFDVLFQQNPSRNRVFWSTRHSEFGIIPVSHPHAHWEGRARRSLLLRAPFEGMIECATWLDERHVAIGTGDGKVHIFDAEDRAFRGVLSGRIPRRVLQCRRGWLKSVDVCLTAPGELIAVYEGGDATCLVRWNWVTRTLSEWMELPFVVRRIVLSADGRSIFITQYLPGIPEFDLSERHTLRTLLPRERMYRISANHTKTVLFAFSGSQAVFLDMGTGVELFRADIPGGASAAAWDGGKRLYYANREGRIIVKDDLPF